MKKTAAKLLPVIVILIVGTFAGNIYSAVRVTESFNSDWIFALSEPDTKSVGEIEASYWRRVDLPHDWSVEHTVNEAYTSGVSGGYVKTGLGWYQKTFTLPESCKGKTVYIDFDGVYMNSEVWVNGHFLGKRPYGFSSFRYELTPHLKFGDAAKNSIVVKVDNTKQMSSRWYTGSGIYRNVELVIVEPVHIDHWGTYVTTPKVSRDLATLQIQTNLKNASSDERQITLKSVVRSAEGQRVAEIGYALSIAPNAVEPVIQVIKVPEPQLWSADNPVLYTLESRVWSDGKLIDFYRTRFGIRNFRFDAKKGFFINGKREKLKGVCVHEDGGSVGVAVPDNVWERRLRILKRMGCNAIRCSHNPFRKEFYDMCDRLGFYVIDEAFDEWKVNKREATYYLYFDKWAERDLTDMILRSRNHPSIIMWSIGNEIRDTREEHGVATTKMLVDICHKIDPARPATFGLNSIDVPNELGICDMVDVMGYNFGHANDKYGSNHAAYPERKSYGSETTHSRQTRGVYLTTTFRKNADKQPNLTDKEIFDFDPVAYNSSYDNAFNEHHNRYSLAHMRDKDWLAGEFRWTAFDYFGEAGAFPSRYKNHGIIDTCGFVKDAYYLYQSVWTEQNVLHILPHWNWEGMEGVAIPVWTYANNCDEVELFLNGESLGKKNFDTKELYCSWDVEYTPGMLKAVARKNGKFVSAREVHTSGKPYAIELKLDRKRARANSRDVVHAKVRILDKNGRFVPTASDRVNFVIEGAGKIIGVDNGDPIDHDYLKADNRKAFHGMCLAIIQTGSEPGRVRIVAKADGLKQASATFTARTVETPKPVHTAYVEAAITYEIPEHEKLLGIPAKQQSGGDAPNQSSAAKLSKEEKIKAREARKAARAK